MSGSSENDFCADGVKRALLIEWSWRHTFGRINRQMKAGLSWMRQLLEPDIVSLK